MHSATCAQAARDRRAYQSSRRLRLEEWYGARTGAAPSVTTALDYRAAVTRERARAKASHGCEDDSTDTSLHGACALKTGSDHAAERVQPSPILPPSPSLTHPYAQRSHARRLWRSSASCQARSSRTRAPVLNVWPTGRLVSRSHAADAGCGCVVAAAYRVTQQMSRPHRRDFAYLLGSSAPVWSSATWQPPAPQMRATVPGMSMYIHIPILLHPIPMPSLCHPYPIPIPSLSYPYPIPILSLSHPYPIPIPSLSHPARVPVLSCPIPIPISLRPIPDPIPVPVSIPTPPHPYPSPIPSHPHLIPSH